MTELVALERALRQDIRAGSVRLLLHETPDLAAVLDGARDRFELRPFSSGDSPLDALLADSSLARVEGVFSSFDSAAAFYGWYIDRPVFLYDGLFWFWKFDQYRRDVPRYLDDLRRIRERHDGRALGETYRHLLGIDYHLTMLLAHHLSTWRYARDGFGVSKRLAAYPELADKTRIVGAVIDPDMKAPEAPGRSHVLVSLSGSLAPVLSFEQNLTFARGALAFALEAYATMQIRLPWYFCCHPRLHEALAAEGRLRDLPRGFFATASFDYRKNLDMIRRAHALFISPGFSSIQEAAFFRTPIFFLPEQNGGQPAQLLMLRQAGYDAVFNWTVTDALCAGEASIGEDDTDELYRGIELLWGERMRSARMASLERFRAVLEDEARRHLLIESQREAALAVFGGFEGAEQVAGHMLDVLAV